MPIGDSTRLRGTVALPNTWMETPVFTISASSSRLPPSQAGPVSAANAKALQCLQVVQLGTVSRHDRLPGSGNGSELPGHLGREPSLIDIAA